MGSKSVESVVRDILKRNMLTLGVSPRDSDKVLLIQKWEREGFFMQEQQKRDFMKCTVAESITRARRKLRAEFPGREIVEQGRYDNYKRETQDQQRAMPWL